jgi:uncharacterized alkaline shock family protein YloU
MGTETVKAQTTEDQKSHEDSPLKGVLTFDDKVIQKVVGYAIENVSGLLGVDGGFVANLKNKIVNSENTTDGIEVEVGQKQVAVDLNIIMEYGHNAHEIYDNLSEVIAEQIEKTTSLTLVELNVQVIDVQTQKEFSEAQTSLQDRVTQVGADVKEKATEVNRKMNQEKSAVDSDAHRVK